MSSIVFGTGSSLHVGKEAAGGGWMVPHSTVVAPGWECGDVLGLFQGGVHEELVVPDVLTDGLFELTEGSGANMSWDR